MWASLVAHCQRICLTMQEMQVQSLIRKSPTCHTAKLVCHNDKEHQKYIDDIASKRKTMVSTGDRSAKIRTYNYPQGRITDHRINYTIYNLGAFMDGDIQDCIDHLIVAENAERLKESEL